MNVSCTAESRIIVDLPQMRLYTGNIHLSILNNKNYEENSAFGQFGDNLQIKSCLSVVGDMQMIVSQGGNAAAPGGSGQKAQLHQIRLVHIL